MFGQELGEFLKSTSKQADSSLYFHRDREQVDLSGGGGVLEEQAISRTVSDDGFISKIFLVPKRKRQMEADPQPQSSKCLHRTPALQNGRYLLCKGPPEQGGLY